EPGAARCVPGAPASQLQRTPAQGDLRHPGERGIPDRGAVRQRHGPAPFLLPAVPREEGPRALRPARQPADTGAKTGSAPPNPDLVILDIRLPGTVGLTICEEIRKLSQVPIIMLTARDEVTDKVVGLEVGADDYLTMPFHPQELVARAKALLRRARSEPDQPKLVRAGKLEVDIERHQVRHGSERVQLRPKEFDLLALLARHPGRVFQRSALLDLVWGYDFPGYTRTVDVHVQQVREKLAAASI